MVEHGLSAKQEKEGRLQDIKREVTEMVKSRVTSLQNQVRHYSLLTLGFSTSFHCTGSVDFYHPVLHLHFPSCCSF